MGQAENGRLAFTYERLKAGVHFTRRETVYLIVPPSPSMPPLSYRTFLYMTSALSVDISMKGTSNFPLQ